MSCSRTIFQKHDWRQSSVDLAANSGTAVLAAVLVSTVTWALRDKGVTTVIISGGETDVCVLATVMGAIDLGYHVILPTDALFGSADTTHDAMLEIYSSRFQTQLTITNVGEVLQLCRDQDA